jgi:hypothetical protein
MRLGLLRNIQRKSERLQEIMEYDIIRHNREA